MSYDNFVKLTQRQDNRNIFLPCDIDLSFVPEPLQLFYRTYNPVNVEVLMIDLTSVRFCPAKLLKQLQDEYAHDSASFIFATQEGDPIYFKSNGIFKSAHGTDMPRDAKISDDFDSYIEMLEEMSDKSF